ncbi:hypothetical protein V1478_003251 [Vespula squamosa]|uniref:Maturase K n=1 Tax=Vespula squamosa TaxID=30214 RepID=A0ABD2BS52_VESSQ
MWNDIIHGIFVDSGFISSRFRKILYNIYIQETNLYTISNTSKPTSKTSRFDHSQRLSDIKNHKLIES